MAATEPATPSSEVPMEPQTVEVTEDGRLVGLPDFAVPTWGTIADECSGTVTHPSLGVYVLRYEHERAGAEAPPQVDWLDCSYASEGAGGSLRSWWGNAPGSGYGQPPPRANDVQMVLCPMGACGNDPASVPFHLLGSEPLLIGDEGRVDIVVYEREPDEAEVLDVAPGMRAVVHVAVGRGELDCGGRWAGRIDGLVVPIAAVELAIDVAVSTCGGLSSTISTGDAIPTTSSTVPDRYVYADAGDEFALVPVRTAAELTEDEAEWWARHHLELLATGRYTEAATLLAGGPYPNDVRESELRPLGLVGPTGDLPERLAAWCMDGDGLCLPAADLYPGVYAFDVECAEAQPRVEPCQSYTNEFYDSMSDVWRFAFTVRATGSELFALSPDPARTEHVIITVGVHEGRVYVRGLPPSRSFGDPDSRLPALVARRSGAPARLELPDDAGAIEVTTDGTDLCLRHVRGGSSSAGCSGDVESLGGILWLTVSDRGLRDPDGLVAVLVADGVGVERIDDDGVPSDPVVRAAVPDVGNGVVWVFGGGFDLTRPYQAHLRFTLPDGTVFET